MKIYYSHAMPTYGTKQEEQEQNVIFEKIPQVEIIDPGSYQNNPEKRNAKDPMAYCLKLVMKCHALVFSRFVDKITAGVGKEVNFALSMKMPVYEINGGKLHQIKKPVEYLSILDTINLPGYYQN